VESAVSIIKISAWERMWSTYFMGNIFPMTMLGSVETEKIETGSFV
jgi:hypothetical protein